MLPVANGIGALSCRRAVPLSCAPVAHSLVGCSDNAKFASRMCLRRFKGNMRNFQPAHAPFSPGLRESCPHVGYPRNAMTEGARTGAGGAVRRDSVPAAPNPTPSGKRAGAGRRTERVAARAEPSPSAAPCARRAVAVKCWAEMRRTRIPPPLRATKRAARPPLRTWREHKVLRDKELRKARRVIENVLRKRVKSAQFDKVALRPGYDADGDDVLHIVAVFDDAAESKLDVDETIGVIKYLRRGLHDAGIAAFPVTSYCPTSEWEADPDELLRSS